MVAFIIWVICGVIFIGFGISAFRSEQAVGFWANVKTPEMADVTAYNKAVGKLWCIAGGIFILLGMPLLMEDKAMVVLVSTVGVVIEMIVVMVVYSLKIEGKYRKK